MEVITNYFISPHAQLSPFVDQYILCTSENEMVRFGGPWAASNETSLIFHLADKPTSHANQHSNSNIEKKDNALVGLLTRHNGLVRFYGRYHTFVIQFNAVGLYGIFGMPASMFTDNIYCVGEVFGPPMRQLYEQLLNAPDIHSMAKAADLYLLSMLRSRKKKTSEQGISVANDFQGCFQPPKVAGYAANANMSIRNFERRFSEQVGISPKLYWKLARFNRAVNSKIMQPGKSWTTIAHECSYYDQMHLIRDFKQFTSDTPKAFFQSYLNSGETTSSGEGNSTMSTPVEKFVHVRRQQ